MLKNVRIPIRPHFGVIGLAPAEADIVDSIPPSYTGGNIDNWRIGKGATMYYPVAVPGALLSVGDPHASQGDSELCGTAIECSLTGTFQLDPAQEGDAQGHARSQALDYPLLETADRVGGARLQLPELPRRARRRRRSREIYAKSSIDLAMRDAFRKMRHFLMTTQGLSEDEAISLMSVAVDFGITQVVDGNWGVHADRQEEPVRRRGLRLGTGFSAGRPEASQSARGQRTCFAFARTPPGADVRLALSIIAAC